MAHCGSLCSTLSERVEGRKHLVVGQFRDAQCHLQSAMCQLSTHLLSLFVCRVSSLEVQVLPKLFLCQSPVDF